MEDFRFDLFIGEGPHAKAVTMQLPRFTLLGATTRMGLLSAPLLDRFGFHWQLRYYELKDMKAIVKRSAKLIQVSIDDEGATEIAKRSRGTPRIANRLLRRVRDFAMVMSDGSIDGSLAASSLDKLAVDHAGLDSLDRAYLGVICERFDGGPIGIEAVAASLSEERGTLEEVVEPFLLQDALALCAAVSCPSAQQLATLAEGTTDAAAIAHLEICAGCRDVVQIVRAA